MQAQTHTQAPTAHEGKADRPATSKHQRRMLTHPQFFKLCEYIRGNHKVLFAEPTTLVALAKEATVFLQFPVSDSAIGQALDATDLRKKVKLSTALRAGGGKAKPEVSRKEFLQLALIVRRIAHHRGFVDIASAEDRIWLDQLVTEPQD